LASAASPPIIPRLSWSADEHRRDPVEYAAAARYVVVHHTAGVNTYTRAQAPAIVRAIQRYHVAGNGWNDIGYNFLVDKYGKVFEGRYGGMTRNVVGAHAQGFNHGSAGAALIGNYGSTPVSAAARDALTRLIAWRLDVAHVDARATTIARSGGNPRYRAGTPVRLRVVSGHRDAYPTSCPGSAAYSILPALAETAATTGGPKLYYPLVNGRLGGPIRFRARLSAPLPWTVTVSDARGTVVAVGRGVGPAVDWTWDASGVPAGRYAYAIEAGPAVRPASGTIGGSALPPLVSDLVAQPAVVSPNGDGQGDTTRVSFRLRARATLTVAVLASDGTTVAPLFAGEQRAGRPTFVWDPAAVPDGQYRVLVSAQTRGGRRGTVTAAVLVSRTLANLAVAPTLFSPNADGRLDEVAFSFELRAVAEVTVSVRRQTRTVATIRAGSLPPGSHGLRWDGKVAGKRLRDGRYRAVLKVKDAVGTSTRSITLVLDAKRPRLRLLSRPALRFSLTELATVSGFLNGTAFRFVQKAGKFSLPLTGPVQSLRVVAEDNAGNESVPVQLP
ncbi:MAG: N-acetylmuramoyl-L-alanine amidase, partial [Actinomycetota bacterium]|nr:N-acetylmuramoyl-L-alanine amidase [Actinomycetota bacterium]